MLLSRFFMDLYVPLRLRSRSKNTIRLYKYSLGAFDRFLGRAATLDDLNDDTVGMYLSSIVEKGLSAWSVAKERSQLVALWTFAAKRGLVAKFPDVPPERTPKRAPVAWTTEEVHAILEAATKLEGDYHGVPRSRWWIALHRVLWDTGERIGATLRLEWEHVHHEWLTVPAELRKGRREDKVFRLSRDCLDALDRIRFPSRKRIFPWPFSPTLLYKHYQRLLEAAKLPSGRASKFHRLRRTVASYYHAAGGNATELLGHSDPRVTMRYLDPRLVAGEQPSDLLPRI